MRGKVPQATTKLPQFLPKFVNKKPILNTLECPQKKNHNLNHQKKNNP